MQFFEQNLAKYICRLGFIKYLAVSKLLILNGFVKVNKKIIKNSNYLIKLFDIISINPLI